MIEKTIQEAIDQLKELTPYYLASFYGKDRMPIFEIEGQMIDNEKDWVWTNEDSDIYLNLVGFIYITPVLTTVTTPTICGNVKMDVIEYTLQRVETVRGCYMRRDGSGEPDTTEIVDIKLDKQILGAHNAICQSIKLLVEDDLNNIGEQWFEDRMANMVEEQY